MYFYDSYAIIEYLRGNWKYKRYFEEAEGTLTSMNLVEVHYHLLAEFSEKDVDECIKDFWIYIVEPKINELIEASKFRRNNRKRNLSYSDCIGYTIAKKRGIKFLTGDKEFESMDNVEFVR